MTELVIVTDDGPVRTVRMNRPEKKNALTLAMYDAMAAAIEGAGKDPGPRCLLIAGVPTAFCAGNDIGDFLKMAIEGGALGAPILRFLYALARSATPLIAAVQGNAVGVGTPCLCIAIMWWLPTTRGLPHPSSASAWCRKRLPACSRRGSWGKPARFRCW